MTRIGIKIIFIRYLKPVLYSYYQRGYKKIIAAAHGGVIRRFIGHYEVIYCTPYRIQYDGQFMLQLGLKILSVWKIL